MLVIIRAVLISRDRNQRAAETFPCCSLPLCVRGTSRCFSRALNENFITYGPAASPRREISPKMSLIWCARRACSIRRKPCFDTRQIFVGPYSLGRKIGSLRGVFRVRSLRESGGNQLRWCFSRKLNVQQQRTGSRSGLR